MVIIYMVLCIILATFVADRILRRQQTAVRPTGCRRKRQPRRHVARA